jgi:hypothetical protein
MAKKAMKKAASVTDGASEPTVIQKTAPDAQTEEIKLADAQATGAVDLQLGLNSPWGGAFDP